MKRFLAIALFLCTALAAGGWTMQTSRTQWEYKIVYKLNEKRANELGSDGWELVAIGGMGSGPASNVETFVFKRPK